MTVEYLRYAIAHRRAEGFRQAYARAASVLLADPRCLSYEICQSPLEPTRFLIRIEWDSATRQLEDLRREPGYAEFFDLVDPYANDIVDRHCYQVQLVSPDVPEKGRPSLYEWRAVRLPLPGSSTPSTTASSRTSCCGPSSRTG